MAVPEKKFRIKKVKSACISSFSHVLWPVYKIRELYTHTSNLRSLLSLHDQLWSWSVAAGGIIQTTVMTGWAWHIEKCTWCFWQSAFLLAYVLTGVEANSGGCDEQISPIRWNSSSAHLGTPTPGVHVGWESRRAEQTETDSTLD